MKTTTLKAKDIHRSWHLIDAKDQVLGRIATNISQKLIGKSKPNYTPNLDGGDYVVVINASQVKLTGRKTSQKLYRHHTGFPGGFREIPFATKMAKDPRQVIEAAVSGMLPKNKLRSPRLKRLKVFAGSEHPYQNQLTPQES